MKSKIKSEKSASLHPQKYVLTAEKKYNPTVISFFAGGGGSSLGYKLAGFKELLAVDFDKNPCDTLRANFDFPVWQRDIKNVAVDEVLELCKIRPGELDVLDGSPPCQGFSTAGKRDVKDSRNDLFKEYVRMIEGLKPKVFVMENVSGMIKGDFKHKFNEILNKLNSTDYTVKVKLMNAMWYNVPQSRERLIFIGIRKDLNKEPAFPVPADKVITLKDAIGHLGNIQDESLHHVWVDESTSGKNTKTYSIADAAKEGQKYASQQKRLSWNKPAATITKSFIKRPYLRNCNCHPKFTRTLSILEMAICSSFPQDYVWPNGSWQAQNIIGNAVMPNMMKAIALTIRQKILQV